MNLTRKHLLLGLGAVALLAAPRVARADASYNLRKAYTGTAGGSTSNFGAGYRLEYGLAASKSGTTRSVSADAAASTWAKLFGMQFDAVSVKLGAAGSVSNSCTSKVTVDTYLVGIKLPAGSSSGFSGGTFNRQILVRSQPLTPKVSFDIVRVGPFSLGFDAYAYASEYINVNGALWCSNITAEIRPGVKLVATGDFHVDAVIAASGMRATLSLMDSSLPLKGNVSWLGTSQADFFSGGSFCTWQLNSSAAINFEIVAVNGKFEPYVRVGLPCTDIFGLLPGKGICLNKEWSHVLYSFSSGKSVFPLVGTPNEVRIGDNTSTCGPAIPAPTPR
jgi:hypothetical protein